MSPTDSGVRPTPKPAAGGSPVAGLAAPRTPNGGPRQTAETPGRIGVVDAARGLVIVLVVVNHVIDGLAEAGLLAAGHPLVATNRLLYHARMPTLAFLIGLFVPSGVRRAGPVPYLRRRVTLLGYVYIVWYVVTIAAALSAGGRANHPLDPGAFLRVWQVPGVLWFLPSLALLTVTVVAVSPWQGGALRRGVALVLLGSIPVAAWGVAGDVVGERGWSLVGFVGLGAALGRERVSALLVRHAPAVAAIGLLAGSLLVAVATDRIFPGTLDLGTRSPLLPAFTLADRRLSVLVAALGVVALVGCGALLHAVPGLGRVLERAGRSTLEIYVVHSIVTAAVRIALLGVGARGLGLHLVAGWGLGVAVPLVLATYAARLHLGWLFRPPGALMATPRRRAGGA